MPEPKTEQLTAQQGTLMKEWDDVFAIAGVVPTELIGATLDSVELGEFEDYDSLTDRDVKIGFDGSGKPMSIKVTFQTGVGRVGHEQGKRQPHVHSPKSGLTHYDTARTLTIDRDSLKLGYGNSVDEPITLMTRSEGTIKFSEGIGKQRQQQALGYLGIASASLTDSLERYGVMAV